MVISFKKIVVEKLNTGPIWSRIQEVTMEGPTGSFHFNPLPPSFLGKYNLAIILGHTFCVFLSRFASSSFGPLHDTCPVPAYCYCYFYYYHYYYYYYYYHYHYHYHYYYYYYYYYYYSHHHRHHFHFVYFSSWCWFSIIHDVYYLSKTNIYLIYAG